MLRIRHEMTSVPCPDGRGNAPINHFANASKFATPDDRTVVAPNTDTLYSLSQLDLKKGPIVLRHPDMGDRFFDFELVDPWTNVIGLRRDADDRQRRRPVRDPLERPQAGAQGRRPACR